MGIVAQIIVRVFAALITAGILALLSKLFRNNNKATAAFAAAV